MMKEKFFYRNWWLFYLLFFLLLGWLIYALLWQPNNCATEVNDFKNKNNALISEITDLKNKNKSLITDLQDCQNDSAEVTPPVQQIVDCNATVKSGGQGTTTTNHRLGKQPGNILVEFDADNIPDEFKVFYDGQLVASSNGLVSHDGEMNWQYNAEQGKPDFCTVEVSAPKAGTSWQYRVNCPQ